ncbi:phosphatase PAP2 family protein [Streptomyces sp. MP131-18]|uniref:phosphatase PAP2 family protein n=1 Tax=Streptomyces sp. MP131-18 TaxID=1857892 RepID=UPI0009A15241|nr:phosphatase PAP2 family protein [Streptomyces sp. MP131-18]ONK12397.1 undecaprenyl pyrophosphate phosphatase [Streptomyces sp. MP131-18]
MCPQPHQPHQPHPRLNTGGRAARLALAAAVTAACALILRWLSPGGLGSPGPETVTGGVSADLYRTVTDGVADVPHWAAFLGEAATEAGLVVLGLLLLWTGRRGLRRTDPRLVAGVLLTGAATVAAYGLSESLKLVVDQERPCRAVPGADALAACPPPGDWSFPSNHATLAVALATGLVWLWPRAAAAVVTAGAATAALRVVIGVHYPHDVLAGAALGAAVTAAAMLVALPAVTSLVAARFPLRGRPPRQRPGSARRAGTGSS